MIDLSKLEGFTAFSVVPADRVGTAGPGWTVLAVVDRSEIDFPPRPGSYSYDAGGCARETPRYDEKHAMPLVVQSPLFLLGKRRDDELDDLREKTAAAWKERDNAAADWRKAEHKLRTVEKERDELRSSVEVLGLQLGTVQRAEIAEKNLRRKLEEDLAKVRREVGEKEWKRIIGGGT